MVYKVSNKLIRPVFLVSLMVIGLSLPIQMAKAQGIDPKFQSVFLYGVARKIEWSSSAGVFKIAIIGKNKALVEELKKLASVKELNGKSVRVEEMSAISGALNHDIVFMAGESKSQLSSLLSKASSSTLVATAYSGAIDDGSYINFVLKGNKVTFELNKTAIGNTSLKVTDDLLKLASVVR